MSRPVVIETERLTLRPLLREDFDAWAALMADPEATRFIGGVQHRAVAWRGFMTMAGAWALDGFAMFSLIERASGRWIGRVGPWQPDGWPGTEVGWSLVTDAQGKGFAAEAATATIDWAFEHLGWSEVIHTIDVGNVASIRLAERLGSERRGPVKLPPPFESHPAEVHAWAQTRQDWQQRRKSPSI